MPPPPLFPTTAAAPVWLVKDPKMLETKEVFLADVLAQDVELEVAEVEDGVEGCEEQEEELPKEEPEANPFPVCKKRKCNNHLFTFIHDIYDKKKSI